MESWYALQSKAHKEFQVRASLETRGLVVFLPLIKGRTRTRVNAEKPFFPGYLFVRADLEQTGISAVQYTPGLRRIVSFSEGEPSPVADQIITHLQDRLAVMNAFDQEGEVLKQGDRVVITSGVLRDYEALFDRRLSPEGRVRLLIQLLARQVPIDVTTDMIRKVRTSRPN
jgi:transcriptional antiterminator RfaH